MPFFLFCSNVAHLGAVSLGNGPGGRQNSTAPFQLACPTQLCSDSYQLGSPGEGWLVGWLVWSPCTESASTTMCLTALRLPFRTREPSGDRHCHSQSTAETIVRCSVLCTLTAAVTEGRAPLVTTRVDALHGVC